VGEAGEVVSVGQLGQRAGPLVQLAYEQPGQPERAEHLQDRGDERRPGPERTEQRNDPRGEPAEGGD
jgi:hypothetical protein